MPVAVRNKTKGLMVFSPNPTSKGAGVEWSGAGARDGSDVQQIPDDLSQHPGLLRAIRRGHLEVVGDSELADSMRRYAENVTQIELEQQSELEKVMVRPDGTREVNITAEDMERLIAVKASQAPDPEG